MTGFQTSSEPKSTIAWVLHPNILSETPDRDANAALDEALALAIALPGLNIVGSNLVTLKKPRPGTLFGTGKISELGIIFKTSEVELVLIDGPVTPVQQRNLEKEWNVKILDRTGLILEIFSDRARTREGVLQVEMAALAYQRTRLVRAWTHLERQRGGLGFVGGPGETQIEADRRAIDDELGRLRKQLTKVSKTRSLHREARAKVPFPIVALVGYTNAGKSTFFNHLTGADVMAKDMLFATLDPTMRSVKLPSGPEIILSDTVGFISNLPTQLVAAFRATLEEVLSADVICHVRDISHPDSEEQAKDVESIMAGLNVDPDVPVVEIWNKVDLLTDEELQVVRNKARRLDNTILGSALTGVGLNEACEAIAQAISGPTQEEVVELGFADGKDRAWLFKQGVVLSETSTESGHQLHVRWSANTSARFAAFQNRIDPKDH